MRTETTIEAVVAAARAGQIESIALLVRTGLITPAQIASAIEGVELNEDGILVPQPGRVYADDGEAEAAYDSLSPEAAARAYVERGEWGDESCQIHVVTYRRGVDGSGNVIRVDEDDHFVQYRGPEPDCSDDEAHDWANPHELVGGCEENPGVWSSGGGVEMHAVCLTCGLRRITDTWGTDPYTGAQGIETIRYEEPEEADLAALRAYLGEDGCSDEEEAAL